MEVAGVALGALPIIVTAFEAYPVAAGMAKSYWKWDRTIRDIKRNFFIQKRQLDITLSKLNLDAEKSTLEEIQVALATRCPDTSEQFLDIIQHMAELMDKLKDKLGLEDGVQPHWADSTSKRMTFEWYRMKRSILQKQTDQIFGKLQNLNTGLANAGIERREIVQVSDIEHQYVTLVRTRFDDEKSNAIRSHARILYKALAAGYGCNCSPSHVGNLELSWHNVRALSIAPFTVACSSPCLKAGNNRDISWKAISIKIEEISSPAQSLHPPQSPSWSSTPNRTRSQSPQSQKSFSSGKPQVSKRSRVVRFLSAPAANPPPTATTSSPPSSQQSVSGTPPSTNLAIKLCEVLHSAPSDSTASLGHISVPDIPEKLVRVHHIADKWASFACRSIHLDSLLCGAIDTASRRPLGLSRKQRFGVAAGLCWAVLHLSDSPWMKSVINNEDVQLYLGGHSPDSQSLSANPYLSADLSSPNPSSVPCPHPANAQQYRSNRIRSITLFTLAIRLVELGLNKPFIDLHRKYQLFMTNVPDTSANQQVAAAAADELEVTEWHLRDLERESGKQYADAAHRCLRFMFPGTDDKNTFGSASFRKAFFDDVVAPIQANFEQIPGSCDQVPI